jgi:hypothetical protein
MSDINNLIEIIISDKENLLQRINNTTRSDILKLRNDAAEIGIEFTPDEVVKHIELLKEIISDG